MGNRAVVVFADNEETSISPAVYFHWNGGPESIYQFLDELDRRKIRADQNYECARFIQVASEHMDGGLSLGVYNGPSSICVKELSRLAQGDNGIYVVYRLECPGAGEIGKKWRVRRFEGHGDTVTEFTAKALAAEARFVGKNRDYEEITSSFDKKRTAKQVVAWDADADEG